MSLRPGRSWCHRLEARRLSLMAALHRVESSGCNATEDRTVPEHTAKRNGAAPDKPSAPGPSSRTAPTAWVLEAYRAGERTQIMALAEALSEDCGWTVENKPLAHRRTDFVPGLLRSESLAGLHIEQSGPLTPPWPDVLISAGMRNEPVARWIRRQSNGRTRLVWIGRPWAPIGLFDLIVTTPQYRLPERPNVLQNIGTLHRITPETLADAAGAWTSTFDHLPRPVVGVVAGGHSGPLTFGPAGARKLGKVATAMAGAGSVIATTSPRTTTAATDALESVLTGPHFLFRWEGQTTTNPYLAILATADRLIVTSDTVSMLSEAVATAKPVEIFDLGNPSASLQSVPIDADQVETRLAARIYRGLMDHGPRRATRDLSLFHRELIRNSQCRWVGEPGETPPCRPLGDLERAVERVRELVGDIPGG